MRTIPGAVHAVCALHHAALIMQFDATLRDAMRHGKENDSLKIKMSIRALQFGLVRGLHTRILLCTGKYLVFADENSMMYNVVSWLNSNMTIKS
ncbi:hypothetical protein SODALDRAFT_356571 [Sodiomyces alkalinus F11]|uniref:Uncharacterized protein n=1 Tax=Sodiomyces alkalinus (strain CBS 110278 / VKM F-3762 / F11) TaxID=1314773 RepID=A0A3N2Q1F5_SODAK|nr:hypothetical protein SODALDRAFT_356571 [Sodiomyces alkalinus F11]ROT40562.1 hypothetical protein SODALDRAFT_356571 [Sodiomyces alkalinus F11]